MAPQMYGYNNYGRPYNSNVNNQYDYYQQQSYNSYDNGSHSNYSVAYVNSEMEAYNYPVAPGNTIILMDLNNNRFYMKSSDFNGNPQTMRVYEYTEVIPEKRSSYSANGNFVTREEFEELKRGMAALPMKQEEIQNGFVPRKEFDDLKAIVDDLIS